jgi:Helix-turn-helix domain
MSVQAIGWAFDQQINDALAKLVLLALANHSNGKSGRCTPKVDTLAAECAQTPSNVKKKLAYLEQNGLIKRVSRFAPSGTQLANGYVLLLDAEYRPFASTEPTSPDEPWEDEEVSEQVGGGYPTREGEGIQNEGVGYPMGAPRVSGGSGGRVSHGRPPGYPTGAPHIEPESEPEKKNRKKESASQTLRAHEEGSGNLFSEAGNPTNPSPSPSSAVPQGKAELGESQNPPRSSAPPPRENATVATPPDAAAGCGVPKRRRTKPAPPPDTPQSEEFWRLYPRHDGKFDFRFAFANALTKATAAELTEGARRYAAERASEDPKFTKHASTWLNKEGWREAAAPTRVIDQFGNPDMPPPRANGHAPRRSRNDEAADRTVEKFLNRGAS